MDIKRDDYIFLDVTWETGFKHIVPCRGFNLQSQLKFSSSLDYVKSVTYRVVPEKQYMELLWVSSVPVDVESKTLTTPTMSSVKAKPSTKTATKKPSATKPSVKTASKNTKKQASSSKAKKTPSVGLTKETKNERRASKGKTQQETPTKGNSRTKASEDSKAVRKPQRASKPAAKRTTSSSKEARTELREPKVRNVRKPKKDVQGVDNSGEASLPRTRSRTVKAQ
jgi:hypothetical protein